MSEEVVDFDQKGSVVDLRKFFTMLSEFLNGKYDESRITKICSLLPFSEEKRNELAVEYLLFRIGREKND